MAKQEWCQAVHPETGDKCVYGRFHPKLPHCAKLSEVRTEKVAANGARYIQVTDTVWGHWNFDGIIVRQEENV